MKNPIRLSIAFLAACGSAGAETTVIDDFSGDPSGYTATVILDDNGGAANTSVWQTYDGSLEIYTSAYDGIEQWAFIRNGLTLPVGKEIQAVFTHSGHSQDFGLYVGGSAPVAGVRANYISLYARSSGLLSTRGFDGTSEFGVITGPGQPIYDKLFIARTGPNTFDIGYYAAGVRTVFATRTPTTPNEATAVGIYADVRDTGFLGTIDTLSIADIPSRFDADADGLIDSFELFYFNHLDETAAGNTDGDAFDHLAEQNAGSDPTNPASVPGDVNGNGIPDENEPFQPYTVDAHTLHLWHFDEILPPVADAGSDPVALESLNGGAYLWAPSLAGFGTGLDANRNAANGTGGHLSALPLANGTADNTNIVLTGENGAFTFEAIVKLGFDPTTTPDSANALQILSADGENDPLERGFQFRILPVGNGEHAGGGIAELEFLGINFNGTSTDVSRVKAPLPGGDDPDAAVQGRWYHVAAAYNGDEATPDNLTLYWTLLDPERTAARVLSTGQLDREITPGLTPDFVIGNEGRSNGGASDGFLGVIDEVRISDIARGPADFLFGGESDAYDDFVAGLPAGQRGENDDPDGDGHPNLVEFAFGTAPGNGGDKPAPLSTGSVSTGASLNTAYGLSLDPAKNYRVVEVEVPADLKGLSLGLAVSRDLTFTDGATATRIGAPVDHGATQTLRYLLNPAMDDAPKLFWRLVLSR